MSLKAQVLGFVKRFGAPAKFAAKQILNAVLPGSPAVVELVGQALDCAHETAKDQFEVDEARLPPATAADLNRVEEVIGILAGDLQTLVAQVGRLDQWPDAVAALLEGALATGGASLQAALKRLDDVARRFD